MSGNALKKNMAIWDRIYAGGEPIHNLPSEDLVIGVNRYLPRIDGKEKKLLDIGCGPGNNLAFLAGRGFDCYGVDISAAAIEIAKNRLAREGLKAKVRSIKQNTYPFKDNFFDVVIVWYVLVYNDEESLPRVLAEIRRVLRHGGVLLANFPTLKDFSTSHGKKIGRNTFELSYEGGNQKGAIATGAENEEDVKTMFSSFANLEIGYSEISLKGITYSNWLIYGN